MTDDLGLFRDTRAAPERGGGGRRRRRQARERRRRRRALFSVVAVLVLAVTGVVVGVREIRALREVPDFVGAGGTQAVVEVEDGQSLTAIGATLARQNVIASVRAFTRAAEADPRVLAVQPGYYQLRERMSGAAAVARLQEPNARVGHLAIRGGEQLDNVELPDGKVVPGLLAEISRASCAMIRQASTCVLTLTGMCWRKPFGLPDARVSGPPTT